MTIIRFTPRAKRHLSEIWDYSARRWGERRADRYLKAINSAIVAVLAGKRRLQICEQYGAGLQLVRAESHNVYLRLKGEVCEVIGVLHQRMEPSLHLPKD